MAQIPKRFLLIDDDPLNNFLTKMILKKSFDEVYVKDFSIPEEGLEFMKIIPSNNLPDGKTIVFLDLNMPTLSGWEFLDAFELFDVLIKEHYDIFILSSSINIDDINRAKSNPLVLDFIEKPLNKAKLVKIFG